MSQSDNQSVLLLSVSDFCSLKRHPFEWTAKKSQLLKRRHKHNMLQNICCMVYWNSENQTQRSGQQAQIVFFSLNATHVAFSIRVAFFSLFNIKGKWDF